MITIDEIMKDLGYTKDQEAADHFGRSTQAISNWRRDGMVPATIERMYYNNKHNINVAGDGNNIGITQVSEPIIPYSAASVALQGVISNLPEKYIWKIVSIAIGYMDELNGNGKNKSEDQ